MLLLLVVIAVQIPAVQCCAVQCSAVQPAMSVFRTLRYVTVYCYLPVAVLTEVSQCFIRSYFVLVHQYAVCSHCH